VKAISAALGARDRPRGRSGLSYSGVGLFQTGKAGSQTSCGEKAFQTQKEKEAQTPPIEKEEKETTLTLSFRDP